MDYEGYCY